jgi:hypothetical protein
MKDKIKQEEWNDILTEIKKLKKYEEIVFIGGIAVFLHLIKNRENQHLIEFSHDIVLAISLVNFYDLRTEKDIIKNNRLNKHEMISKGISIDIYVEKNNSLCVPFEEILQEKNTTLDNFNIASLEHLLILKLKAFEDRKNSSKGDKDKRDIIKIIYLMSNEINMDIFRKYFLDVEEIKETLSNIIYNANNYIDIVENRKIAKELSVITKQNYEKILTNFDKIEEIDNNKMDSKKTNETSTKVIQNKPKSKSPKI